MMRLFGKWLAPWYSGLAFSKFANGKYQDAIRLFEKVIKLDPEADRIDLIYSCLGRCHLALGQLNEALETLNIAYELFLKQKQGFLKNNFEKRDYKEFLDAYSYVLRKFGHAEHALEIEKKAREVSGN
jgi:tetratricopeptide (TPR) repeat protein